MRRLSNGKVILEREEADVHELLQHVRDLLLLSLELLEVVERHPRCVVLAGLVALTDVEVGAQQHLELVVRSRKMIPPALDAQLPLVTKPFFLI